MLVLYIYSLSIVQSKVPEFLKASTGSIKKDEIPSKIPDTDKRKKYLKKLQAIKDKAKKKDGNTAVMPSWRVNEGTNVFLQTIALRGISLAVIPTLDKNRMKEYEEFRRTMINSSLVDVFISSSDALEIQKHRSILTNVCRESMGCDPRDVMVIAAFNDTIKSARVASCMTTRYKKRNEPLIRTDYSIPHLKEFNFIIEELNGISYRTTTQPPKPSKYY